MTTPAPARGPRALAWLRALRRSAAGHHQLLRFATAGGLVALVYLGLGVALSGPLGVPIQVAIPIAYVVAVSLHYSLQRWFVFAHADAFALGGRAQLRRYVAVGAGQYALQALATSFLPDVLGVSEQVVFVAVAVLTPIVSFVVLRAAVFHQR